MQTSVAEYLLRTAAERPHSLAVADEHTQLSHAALLAEATALARRLRAADGGRRLPVAILLPKTCAAVAAIAGCTVAGLPYVPLDTQSPPERLRTVLQQLGEAWLVCSPATEALAEALGVPGERRLLVPAHPDARPDTALDDDLQQARHLVADTVDTDPVYVIFTSGSTGVPKGVTIAHRSVIDYIAWARATYPVDHTDRFASQAPLHFDNSTLDLYLCLATGAALLLPPDKLYAFPARVLAYLDQQRITTVFWVPSVLVAIANAGLLARWRSPHLRHVLFAGEQMPVKQINAWVQALPGVLFSNLYGPTEITVDCTAYTFRTPFDGPILPIGHARRNTQVLVLDAQDRACGPDEVGELCVRGTALALGYWNDPERTAAVFVQNPLERRFRDPIYRTGDLVRRAADGLITFVGRKDTQIKHNGYRIELGEIEAAAASLEGVAQACALYDAASRRIVLFVQWAAGQVGDAAALTTLRRGLATRLPKYMLPSHTASLADFPLNGNGKVDRLALARLLDLPAPAAARPAATDQAAPAESA